MNVQPVHGQNHKTVKQKQKNTNTTSQISVRNLRIDESSSSAQTAPSREECEPSEGSINGESGGAAEADVRSQSGESEEEAIAARAARVKPIPTAEQVRIHNLTHAQYRSWCPHCVRGRGGYQNHTA